MSSVPMRKETRAAGRLPVALPRPALIGACRAPSTPTPAVSRTATLVSMVPVYQAVPTYKDAGVSPYVHPRTGQTSNDRPPRKICALCGRSTDSEQLTVTPDLPRDRAGLIA